jgi:hypothetical protein
MDPTTDTLEQDWLEARDRLRAKGLFGSSGASLSLRCASAGALWFGAAEAERPRRLSLPEAAAANGEAPLHAAIYLARPDVGAIACGGGEFGAMLADFGGVAPVVFDEQARHLGVMGTAVADAAGLAASLHAGGNALVIAGRPACFGTTCQRLVLNAELFEKCAKACVLAMAAGGTPRPLPWWVRRIANGRLMKDERRAAQAFAKGRLPDESTGY